MSDELVNQDKVTILEGDLVTQFWRRGRVNRYPAYTFLAKFYDVGSFFCERPEHLSVYQTSPKLWEREAFEEKLDGAPEAMGEPGKFSAGELGRLTVRVFFSAGAGLLAWSHMPVETAQ